VAYNTRERWSYHETNVTNNSWSEEFLYVRTMG
jgi:hypothetical protein